MINSFNSAEYGPNKITVNQGPCQEGMCVRKHLLPGAVSPSLNTEMKQQQHLKFEITELVTAAHLLLSTTQGTPRGD